jgi:hypothetical protein
LATTIVGTKLDKLAASKRTLAVTQLSSAVRAANASARPRVFGYSASLALGRDALLKDLLRLAQLEAAPAA